MMDGWFGFGWIVMLIQLLVIGGVIYLIVSLLKKDENVGRTNRVDAELILRERFARGEITQDEFERMREVLRK